MVRVALLEIRVHLSVVLVEHLASLEVGLLSRRLVVAVEAARMVQTAAEAEVEAQQL